MPQISTDNRTCLLQRKKLVINCSPWLVGAASFRAASDSRPPDSMVDYAGGYRIGVPTNFMLVFENQSFFSCLFIQKGENYGIKYRYITLDKIKSLLLSYVTPLSVLNSASRPQPSLQVSVRDCHYTTICII